MNPMERIEQLALRSQEATTPPIDVVEQVCRSIRLQQDVEPALLDIPSLACAGLSLAVTGVAAIWFSPFLSTLFDPWSAYMTAPWSL